jgi:hypothetical protein
MRESFHNHNYICLFILGDQDLGCKAFEPFFIEELVFDLYMEHVYMASNLLESKPLGGENGMK